MKIARISLDASSNQNEGGRNDINSHSAGVSPAHGMEPAKGFAIGAGGQSKADTAVDFWKNGRGEESRGLAVGGSQSYSIGRSFGTDSNGNAHHDEVFSQLSTPARIRSLGGIGRGALLTATVVGLFLGYNYLLKGQPPVETIFNLIGIGSGEFVSTAEPPLVAKLATGQSSKGSAAELTPPEVDTAQVAATLVAGQRKEQAAQVTPPVTGMKMAAKGSTPRDANSRTQEASEAGPGELEAAGSLSSITDALQGNPYWKLPNEWLGPEQPPMRDWTPEEEYVARRGVAHQYPYQRFKTLMTLGEEPLAGSEMLLWYGLKDTQLWIRMAALRGLVNYGKRPSVAVLQQAIGPARSDQLANYLLRYSKSPTAADAYLARAFIRLLDGKGRRAAIMTIESSADSLRDLYRIAAFYDPAPSMQAYMARSLRRQPIAPVRVDQLTGILTHPEGGRDAAPVRGMRKEDWNATLNAVVDPAVDIATELEDLGLDLDSLTTAPGFATLDFETLGLETLGFETTGLDSPDGDLEEDLEKEASSVADDLTL